MTNGQQPTKVGRARTKVDANTRRAEVYDDDALLLELDELIGWRFNRVLTGLNFARRQKGWLGVIKVDTPSGPKVAYVGGVNYKDVLKNACMAIKHGSLLWDHDQWPPKGSVWK